MRTSSAMRVSCYICFVFALLCTIPQLSSFTGVFAFASVIWTAICMLISRSKSPILRVVFSILGSALIPLVFWKRLVYHPVVVFIIAAMAVLFAIFMGLGRFDQEYWKFRRIFISITSVAFFTSFLNIIIYIAVDRSTKEAMNLEAIVGFSMVCALLGVFILSELRKGDADAKWKAMNSTRIVAILSLALAALLMLYFVLSFGFSLIKPIIGPVAQKLKNDYIAYDSHTIPYSMTIVNPDGETGAKDAMEEDTNTVIQSADEGPIFPWWVIAVSALGLVAIISVLVIIHLRKRRALTGLDGNEKDNNDAEVSDDVMKIRAVFRQYMSLVRQSGGELTKGSTSEDILESSNEILEADDKYGKELRDIYIRARYGKADEVEPEDVRRAQELLDLIRTEKEADKQDS